MTHLQISSNIYQRWVKHPDTKRLPHSLKALLTQLYWEWVSFHSREKEESSQYAIHWKLNRFEHTPEGLTIFPDDRLVRSFKIGNERMFDN